MIVTSGPDLRADRSRSVHRQPVVGAAGPCNRASRRWRWRKGDAGHRARSRCPIRPARPSFTSNWRCEMQAAVAAALPADAFIAAAAVADWRVERCRNGKDQERRRRLADPPSGRKSRYSCGGLEEYRAAADGRRSASPPRPNMSSTTRKPNSGARAVISSSPIVSRREPRLSAAKQRGPGRQRRGRRVAGRR